jgi:hypothetical protein
LEVLGLLIDVSRVAPRAAAEVVCASKIGMCLSVVELVVEDGQ